jgi:PAS domain S-box-containing protein
MNAAQAAAVLIVEDELIVARDLQGSLREMGYDAFAIAASAAEALDCASARRPDVVLMDIRIRGREDGIRTAELIKKKYPVSIIYLTAHADEAMVERAKRTEPQGYLLKPVKIAELRSMIEIALYKRTADEARERQKATERRLGAIADNVPVSIGYFDRLGRVQFANHVFRELVAYGAEELGVSAKGFLGDALYKESYRYRQRAMAGERVSFVAQLAIGGVSLKKHEVTYLPDRDSSGTIVGVYALGYDVTEREQMSEELQQARADLEAILNTAPASITSWRVDLTNRFANHAAEAQFGIQPGKGAGMHVREFMGEDRYQGAQAVLDAALNGWRCSHEQVDRLADSVLRYTHDEYVPEKKHGAVVGIYAVSVDISEVRKSHDQIRDLAQRLESVREEERRAVAVILHDGIAQDLFAMKLDLEHLAMLAKRRPSVRQVCVDLTLSVTRCMDDTRQLANELRPVALAYFQVAIVIREHARRFARHSNINITVTEKEQFPKLDESTQLLLFRAAQEALTNVARHARATSVEITLRAGDGRISMEVEDDGVGISDAAFVKPRSLGLLGIRERFQALGGGLVVRRREQGGTSLMVYLPSAAGDPLGSR